jgi:hypothetical protein
MSTDSPAVPFDQEGSKYSRAFVNLRDIMSKLKLRVTNVMTNRTCRSFGIATPRSLVNDGKHLHFLDPQSPPPDPINFASIFSARPTPPSKHICAKIRI